jgi:predicted nucleotidyltransferase
MSKPNIKQFMPHSNLSPKIWEDENKMIPEVRDTLLKIAQEFLNYIDISLDVIDVTFTGSFANYNYTPYSDIDLHVVIDLSNAVNESIETLIKKFLLAKKDLFNNRYTISVNGVDVELYPQDAAEPHVSSGVFSLDKNSWIIKPKRFTTKPDKKLAEKKYKVLTSEIEEILKQDDLQEVEKLIEKIKNMRKAGLEKSGEMSVENIVYKLIRSSNNLQNLFDKKHELYGTSLSLI